MASNADAPAGNSGPDQTFTTLPALSIDAESVSQVSSSSARLDAEIDPLGSPTEYHFEYLTEAAHQANLGAGHEPFEGALLVPSPPSPEGSAGSGIADVPLSVLVESLTPDTTYRYRLVAHNSLGGVLREVTGREHTFTTQGIGGESRSPGLIDGRTYEMVSPPDKHGASLEMPDEEAGVIQASEDGGELTYFAQAPIDERPAGSRSFAYSQLLSSREGPGVWGTRDITTPEESVQGLRSGAGLTEYKLFSSDLSAGLVEPPGATPLSGAASERTPYLRHDGTCATEPGSC